MADRKIGYTVSGEANTASRPAALLPRTRFILKGHRRNDQSLENRTEGTNFCSMIEESYWLFNENKDIDAILCFLIRNSNILGFFTSQ
jgi:hypothetical protein